MRSEHVLINGKIFVAALKAPFMESGKSYLGALEYKEKSDEVRCHECGEWFVGLGTHIFQSHKDIGAKEYKRQHGLRQCDGLSGLLLSQKRSTLSRRPGRSTLAHRLAPHRATPVNGSRRAWSTRNIRGTCHEQILAKLRELMAQIGRAPTIGELKTAGIAPHLVRVAFNMPYGEVIRMAGGIPNKTGFRVSPLYTDELLTEILRDFVRTRNRTPNYLDFEQGILPGKGTFSRHFGSWANALQAAGLLARANEEQAA